MQENFMHINLQVLRVFVLSMGFKEDALDSVSFSDSKFDKFQLF